MAETPKPTLAEMKQKYEWAPGHPVISEDGKRQPCERGWHRCTRCLKGVPCHEYLKYNMHEKCFDQPPGVGRGRERFQTRRRALPT